MLGKPHYYEKDVDLALGLGELYRIQNHQVGLDQVIREFQLSTQEEAEEILYQCRLNQKITHPNLMKMYAFNFEDLQMEGDDPQSLKEDQMNNLLSKAKQLERIQLAQMKLLEKLSKNPSSLNEKDDLDCFEEFKLRQNQKRHTFSKDNEIDVIDQSLALRKARRVQYIVRVAMEDVPCTLSTEIQRRKDEGIGFRLYDVVSFLKDSINLFASLQFHNQEMRDIYPQNIFISYTRTGSSPHYLYGVSQEHLKFYRKRGTEGSQRFSKLFSRALGYLAPELKENYFKLCFCNCKEEFSTSKAAVFSLGLIALQMASLEDTWGLNFSNDEVINKKIKKLIKQVRIKHSNYLATFLEAMLQFDPNKRMDFLELDQSSIYQELIAEDPEFMSWTVTFDDDKALTKLKENFGKIQTDCREIEQYESNSEETINLMLKLFQHPCKNLETIRFISSPVSIPILSAVFRSQPSLLSLELNSAESFSSDHLLFILRNYSHLKTLKLIKCGINPALISLFQSYPLPASLKTLDLSCNPEIGDRGFKILLFKIKFPALKVLRLGGISSGCSLTLESLRAIYHLAGDQRKIPTDHFFASLKVLDISWNPIDEKGLNYVCMHYMLFKHLKELDMTRCNFLPENLSETLSYSSKQKIAKNIKLA